MFRICAKWVVNTANNQNDDLNQIKKETTIIKKSIYIINSSHPGHDSRHFSDDIFRCILGNEKFCILIEISIKFAPKGPIDNNPALIFTMARRRIGNKPISEPMLTRFTDAYIAALRTDELKLSNNKRISIVWIFCN